MNPILKHYFRSCYKGFKIEYNNTHNESGLILQKHDFTEYTVAGGGLLK